MVCSTYLKLIWLIQITPTRFSLKLKKHNNYAGNSSYPFFVTASEQLTLLQILSNFMHNYNLMKAKLFYYILYILTFFMLCCILSCCHVQYYVVLNICFLLMCEFMLVCRYSCMFFCAHNVALLRAGA